jgi:hypothetical protein
MPGSSGEFKDREIRHDPGGPFYIVAYLFLIDKQIRLYVSRNAIRIDARSSGGGVQMPAEGQEAGAETVLDGAAPEGCEPANSLQMQVLSNAEGQFLRGQSGNPAGRLPGTRNRATMIAEQLFDNASGEVSREAIAKAMNGDSAVLRLIVRSIIGPRRHRASSFALPALRGAADVAPAIAAIAAAAADGAISTAEASEMSQVIERYMRALEVGEIEARLQRLESVNGLAS